jgi:DNA-binding transcriptional LysR family regulator
LAKPCTSLSGTAPMDIKQLKCFASVAEELHFGHAAQRMNMLPSALGRQIKLLEEELGTRLLVRSTRHVALTAAGVVLRRDAKSILESLAAAELNVRRLAGGKGSPLRIGAIESAAVGLLPELLSELRERHPEIETQLIECSSVRQLQHLLAGRLDLGFVRPPVVERDLRYEFLLHETLVVALPAEHVLAGKNSIDIHELAEMRLIMPARQARPHSYKAVMRAFAVAGEEPRIVLEAAERQTMISLVAAGIGLAIVPSWVEKLRVPGVVYRGLRIERSVDCPESELGIAWCEDIPSSSREVFVGLVRSRLAKKVPSSVPTKERRPSAPAAADGHKTRSDAISCRQM